MSHRPFVCDSCTASCTFEKMQMCPKPYGDIDECPVEKALADGTITDRRSTDYDPDFPTEYTYVE